MKTEAPTLDGIAVASPCTVDWEGMTGDARVRHCGSCRLNVYNLSEMTRAEAESLVRNREGRLCVRFYRRADGTVITRDCPVGLRAIRRRMALAWSAAAAMFVAMFTAGCGRAAGGGSGGDTPPPPQHGPEMGRPAMGITAEPPKAPASQPIQGDVADPRMVMGEVHVPEKK
jgi:hypothetical protein